MENKESLCSAPTALDSTGNHVHSQLRLYLDSLHMLTWALLFPIVILHLLCARNTLSGFFFLLLLYQEKSCYVCGYVCLIMDTVSLAPSPKIDTWIIDMGKGRQTVIYSQGRNNSTSSSLLHLFPSAETRSQQHMNPASKTHTTSEKCKDTGPPMSSKYKYLIISTDRDPHTNAHTQTLYLENSQIWFIFPRLISWEYDSRQGINTLVKKLICRFDLHMKSVAYNTAEGSFYRAD